MYQFNLTIFDQIELAQLNYNSSNELFFECRLLMLKSHVAAGLQLLHIIAYVHCLFCMYIPNLSVVCFFICLSYFIFYCALLLFCAQAWHGQNFI